MTETDSTTLERAISLIDRERSYLHEEQRAYEAFRERVRLVMSDPTDATSPSETSERLLAAYRSEVMDALDYETTYGDTLAESLQEELSPTVAGVLLSKDPLTQRRKRDLLVDTTAAIRRRQAFRAELADERAALERFAEELAKIESALRILPECSARKQPLENLLVTWEAHDKLLGGCEQLLVTRQRQLRASERNLRITDEKHALCEYLYGDLESSYPVLSRIASVIDRIDAKRNRSTGSNSTGLSLTD